MRSASIRARWLVLSLAALLAFAAGCVGNDDSDGSGGHSGGASDDDVPAPEQMDLDPQQEGEGDAGVTGGAAGGAAGGSGGT